MSIVIGTPTIRTIGRRVEYVGNHQNYRPRSGTCFQVQTSFSPCQWMLLCHRLCRDIAVMLIASIATWILDILLFLKNVKLETGDSQDLKYGEYRIIGSGATVQSVPRCLLVVKMAIPLFHEGMTKLQRWNHLISE